MSAFGEGPYGSGPFGGLDSMGMGRLVWNIPLERQYESGLDRGVLYPKEESAVPWNGLTAVDESSGEGTVAYYMDGRPTLYLPKPKEFAATLRAYTYPDAFSAMMGVVEVANGMYLDSQMGDSFGLSYRTKVGNAVQGEDAYYKIHLIYNATVAPAQVSYNTRTDSVNPNEFSWDIQAVPSPIDGYRPTAHVTIDTRGMEVSVLEELEDMLYGTPVTEPMMPDLQTLFDLLTFGDSIIIIDNGDGTWTAKGSYQNVYELDDDTFQIDNVDAVLNGDGTFDISTTNA